MVCVLTVPLSLLELEEDDRVLTPDSRVLPLLRVGADSMREELLSIVELREFVERDSVDEPRLPLQSRALDVRDSRVVVVSLFLLF